MALAAGAWGGVYAAGGTTTAAPHLFYLPVIAAAFLIGARGAAITGVFAMILCGPLMPLSVATGQSQPTLNWMLRGLAFVTIGLLVGAAATSLRRSYQTGVQRQIELEIAREFAESSLQRASSRFDAAVTSIVLDRQLHMVFQPIYELHGGHLIAVEALARFDVDEPVTPDVWFARAEQAGLGEQLELTAIEMALETAAQELAADVPVSVNVSPATLCSPNLLEVLDGYDDRQLVLEVTEHRIIEDYEAVARALRELRNRGVRLAVDDAGAGFASLRHIVRLEPDIIKVDVSLTQNVRRDPIRNAIGEALVRLASTMACDLYVEGIEEAGDLTVWQTMGAHAAQGYLLARPGPLGNLPRRCGTIRPGKATTARSPGSPQQAAC